MGLISDHFQCFNRVCRSLHLVSNPFQHSHHRFHQFDFIIHQQYPFLTLRDVFSVFDFDFGFQFHFPGKFGQYHLKGGSFSRFAVYSNITAKVFDNSVSNC